MAGVGSTLPLQFLQAMLLVIGNRCCKRHGTRHADVSEGDNERLRHVANDAAFSAWVRNVGDCVVLRIRDGIMMGAELFDELVRQLDFE
jgi:hypothetical protein